MSLTLQAAEQALIAWQALVNTMPKARVFCEEHHELEVVPCTEFRGYTVAKRYADLNALVAWERMVGA